MTDQEAISKETTEITTAGPEAPAGLSLTVEKNVYAPDEIIRVTVTGADSQDWVGIYAERAEPGSVNAITWQYVNGTSPVLFTASSLQGAGEYGVFLCDNGGYLVLAKKTIRVLSDDRTDYGVRSAAYTSSKEKGVGKASVTIQPSSEKELHYFLYWSADGQRLEDYEPLAQVAHSGEEPFEIRLNDCLFMPAEADGVEVAVKEGLSTSYFAGADDTLKAPASSLRYRFQVISDMHIISGEDRPQHVSHLKAALLDIQKLSPDSIGIFTVGDNTDRGKEENYICLRETVDSVMDENSPPIYYALGNHDLVYGGGSYEEQVALFKQYTGMPSAYYSVDLAGTKFIVLGSESLVGEGTIGEKQLDWLRQELAAAGKNQPVFLFLHQPLIDTVSGSLYSQDPETQTWYGIDTGDILRAILKEYPNAVLFTGHTHWTLESRQPILFGGGADASFVNTAAVGYLWDDNNDSAPGSEGYFIEVYDDYILLRGREFVDGKWCAAAQFLFPLPTQA